MFDKPMPHDVGIACCPDCGLLYELREVTEMDVETIDDEPIPGTWRQTRTVMAWYAPPEPWTYRRP